jgi:hypothetical protein
LDFHRLPREPDLVGLAGVALDFGERLMAGDRLNLLDCAASP